MKKRVFIIAAILLIVCFAAFISGLGLGSVRLSLPRLACAFTGADETAEIILFGLRLPRVLSAGFAGVGLAIAGLLLQTVTGNELCAPSIIGVSAGAGFAVMLFLCFFPGLVRILPLAAFAGAMLTALLVMGIAFVGSGVFERSTLILSGVIVSALLNALISFLSLRYPDVLSTYSAFSIGGFRGVEPHALTLPFAVIILCSLAAFLLSGKLNLLLLGDELAFSLGVNVAALRFISVGLASALCASVVSFAGLLGFVGLAVPHISRMICGHDIRRNMFFSALLGWTLLILADLAGRTLFAPTEVPAGTITAVLGCPFFLYLLLRKGVRR